MKKFFKNFCLRGLISSGFGPLIYGIVMIILYLCGVETSSNGLVVFKAILSTYLIAFVAAGISSIYQEEKLGLGICLLIHAFVLYICYLTMYLVNGWIPDSIISVLIFTVLFFVVFVIIALIIYLVEKVKSNKLNKQLNNK